MRCGTRRDARGRGRDAVGTHLCVAGRTGTLDENSTSRMGLPKPHNGLLQHPPPRTRFYTPIADLFISEMKAELPPFPSSPPYPTWEPGRDAAGRGEAVRAPSRPRQGDAPHTPTACDNPACFRRNPRLDTGGRGRGGAGGVMGHRQGLPHPAFASPSPFVRWDLSRRVSWREKFKRVRSGEIET